MDKLENTPPNIAISDSSILIGMAISLKRIADALEKLTKVPTLYGTPEQLEEWQAMINAVHANDE